MTDYKIIVDQGSTASVNLCAVSANIATQKAAEVIAAMTDMESAIASAVEPGLSEAVSSATATATIKAGEASTSAGIATTKAIEADNYANLANLAAQSQADTAKTTLALLNNDLAWAADKRALVTNDPTNNGIYIKLGASGSGSWSKSAYVPPVLDGSVTKRKTGFGQLMEISVGSITVASSSIWVGNLRYGKNDGTFVEMSGTGFVTSGNYDYIIADGSGSVLLMTKGLKEFAWQEHPYLLKDQFILMYKNNGIWFSDFPFIQPYLANASNTPYVLDGSVIKKKTGFGQIMSITSNPITIASSSIAVGNLRYGKNDGTFVEMSSTFTTNTSGNYDYIIADGSGSVLLMTKGLKEFAWQEHPYLLKDQFILMYKNNGIWFSDFPFIQNVLDRYYVLIKSILPPSINQVEIIVKIGGSVGVDCNYTNIKTAIDSISDNSATNRYTLRVLNGTYDVSNDGNLYLGMKNYVDIVGQSRAGVRIIKRETALTGGNSDATKSTFDPAYYNQTINYASIRNMTVISKNTKCPVHIDGEQLNGTIEIIDCTLINENTASQSNYGNGLACGLRKNQRVVAKGVYSNGMLWAHNAVQNYPDDGCHFELYNCISPSIQVGDLETYGKDVFIAEGCKADTLTYLYYKDYPTTSDPHLRSYRSPSWTFELRGNSFDSIQAVVTLDQGYNMIPSPSAMDEIYGGKWSICEPSIHNFCQNVDTVSIPRFSLVTLMYPETMNGIRLWTPGDRLYGITLDTIAVGELGVVQYAGSVEVTANGTTPINFNDPLELNSSGVAVKRTTGNIIGYARYGLGSGTGTIKVRLV